MVARRIRFYCLILSLCLGTAACAASLYGNYGRISPSMEVTQAFEKFQVKPEYRYYISGPNLNPNALMGLHRDYRIDSATLWREVAMSPARMKEYVTGMTAKAAERMAALHGFELLAPDGRPIGVWYSILRARTWLRINDDGTVRIDTPPLDVYDSDNGGPLRGSIPYPDPVRGR